MMPDSSPPEELQRPGLPFLLDGLREAVKSLSPAYFGMVMATGIVSIAAHLLEMPRIAMALFWLNIAAYVVLWLMNLLRAILFTRHFFSDMIDHQRAPGFFYLRRGVLRSRQSVRADHAKLSGTIAGPLFAFVRRRSIAETPP